MPPKDYSNVFRHITDPLHELCGIEIRDGMESGLDFRPTGGDDDKLNRRGRSHASCLLMMTPHRETSDNEDKDI